jgi:CBS domain-containing protein/effector-binding domain-containing protein
MRSIRSIPQIGPWISAAFEEVAAVVASHDLGPAGPPFARFHDTGDNVVEIEAGFPCVAPIASDGRVEGATLPGGSVVTTTYVGPYDGIGEVHDELRMWVETHHGRAVGDAWEIYLDGPADEPDPMRRRTQVVQPYEGTVTDVDQTGQIRDAPPTIRRVTTRVRDIMSSPVVTSTPDGTLPDVLDLMLCHGISGIPIVDVDAHLVGIVTEADLISKPAYGGTPRHRRPLAVLRDALRGRGNTWAKKSRGLTAGDIMTTTVETARVDDDFRAAARQMVESGVKRLPVVDDGRVVGLISRSDVLRAMHRSDEDLEREIVSILADPMRVPDSASVDVTVEEGVVTLGGTVRFPIDLPVLTSIVWRLPGVVVVRNDVRPTEPNPEPPQSSHPMSDYEYLRYFR